MRAHAQKIQIEGEISEEVENVILPTHFSDSDKIDDNTRDVLNALDPYDDSGHVANWNDNVMTERIQKLVEEEERSMRVTEAEKDAEITIPETKVSQEIDDIDSEADVDSEAEHEDQNTIVRVPI